MFSFKEEGLPIAVIKDDTKEKGRILHIIDEDESDIEPEIDTTEENKKKILQKFVRNKKDLRSDDEIISHSLKTFQKYGKNTKVFPVITAKSYRIAVSGLPGSGKSYFTCEFVKHNKSFQKPEKGSGTFLFSVHKNDPSLKGIKNLIQIDLDEFEKEAGREFTIKDIPKGSTCIFDDIDSFETKTKQKQYCNLRDVALQIGRHMDINVISIGQSPMQGLKTKTVNSNCEYFVVYPQTNKRDVKAFLSSYGGLELDTINKIMGLKTRWCFFKKSVPQYVLFEHGAMLI